MNALVTGTFEAENQAVRAVSKLLRSCVPSSRVRTILPGMRKRLAAHRAEDGPPEPGGITVAVKTSDHVTECLALRVFCEHGARSIERRNAERRHAQRTTRRTLPSVQYPLPL